VLRAIMEHSRHRVVPNRSDSSLKIYFVNATSLAKPNAVELLGTELSQFSCGVALIAETWFTKAHLDSVVGIANYTLFRRDRDSRKGGGVCAYVRNDISCSVSKLLNRDKSNNKNLEILWLECCFNGTSYYVACCYHPPRPVYSCVEFIETLSSDIESIMEQDHNSIVVIAGDFNQLDTSFLTNDLGLVQIVDKPTHGNNLIDKVFVNRPDMYTATVLASILKTKHCAVILGQTNHDTLPVRKRRHVSFYDLRCQNIDKLRYYIGTQDWSDLYMSDDIDFIYTEFISRIMLLISHCVPLRNVTIGSKDPSYITPLVKTLLRRRYRLRRQGHLDEANELAEKINKLISENRSKTLNKLVDAGPKELWSSVKSTAGHCHSRPVTVDPNEINKYFAAISNNVSYNLDSVNRYKQTTVSQLPILYDYEVELELRKIKNTAPGSDGLPSWLFRNCSYELAGVVAHILNCSFITGKLPSSWLRAIVTPVPKISKPATYSEYRPISVTPILSRLAEKLLVNKWLRPSLPPELFFDQYAFKPTGSTTAALVHFTHCATHMLEQNNNFVRCLMIDFSKAFDCVDHAILLSKLAEYSVPAVIINWIVSFLTDRSQACKVNGYLSSFQSINQGIVQGSGLGPMLYLVMKSDLKPLSTDNELFKFADDTTLLVPEHSRVDLATEFTHILAWAKTNKLKLNITKTKEIVLHHPRARSLHMPLPVNDVEQVASAKLLGVIFKSNFKMNDHVDFVMSQCSQRVYLLKLLRSQGLSARQLDQVTHALIVSRLLYALPMWCGFLTAELKNRIEAFLKRLLRYGYLSESVSFRQLCVSSSSDLFRKMQKNTHCLFHLLECYPLCPVKVRPRGHNYILPSCATELHKQSFIVRSLFDLV